MQQQEEKNCAKRKQTSFCISMVGPRIWNHQQHAIMALRRVERFIFAFVAVAVHTRCLAKLLLL